MPFPEGGDEGPTSESAVYDTPSTFSPYDPPENPESVQPTSLGPSPSIADPVADGDTSGADGEPDADPPQGPGGGNEAPNLPKFDERHALDFEGLLYLGRLTETFTEFGHTFVVKTMTTEEMAEIGTIVQPYEGTSARNAVYAAAVVAASVVSVDGEPLPGSITVDKTNELTLVKYPYVKRNWMPSVVERIYDRAFQLEVTAREVLMELGKASGSA